MIPYLRECDRFIELAAGHRFNPHEWINFCAASFEASPRDACLLFQNKRSKRLERSNKTAEAGFHVETTIWAALDEDDEIQGMRFQVAFE